MKGNGFRGVKEEDEAKKVQHFGSPFVIQVILIKKIVVLYYDKAAALDFAVLYRKRTRKM